MKINFAARSAKHFALYGTAVVCCLLFTLIGASLPLRAQADPAKAIVYPMDVIASRGWYITLPSNIRSTPDTVKVGGSPELMTYADEWFRLNDTKNAVVFKARTDGAHTENSSNPRSELREMSSDGKTQAAWSSTSGTHSMEIEQTVNVLPIGSKPVVVVGQIHDADDDVSVFRLEGNTSGDRSIGSLWITDADSSHGRLLTNSYRLGTKFRVGFNVSGGTITYTYNGQSVAGYSQARSFSGAYFKAGSYNQSGGNCTKLPSGPDAGKCDYAEVTIYAVQVCHSGVCTGNAPGSITPVPTNTPVATPTTKPTGLPTAVPPTNTPVATPTTKPTAVPPTNTPVATPTTKPTGLPTAVPPTNTPVATPTTKPTGLPTAVPPTNTPVPAPGAGNVIYLSTTDDGKINGLSFKDEDILAFDTNTKQWQMYFDGSDVGLSAADVDAFAILQDGSLLFSFITGTKVPGFENIDDSDIVRFIPQALGSQTAGTFELYFDGSDVDLTKDDEDIDAIAVLADGRLILSTNGPFDVPGLTGDDTDLLAFTPQSLGADTKGAWSLYFKGKDHDFKPKSDEDIGDVWIDNTKPNAIELYLTTHGNYQVGGLSGDNNDIFGCTLDATTSCAFHPFWDGGAYGLNGKAIDAIEVGNGLVNANIVAAAGAVEADDGGAANDVEPAEENLANAEEAEIALPNQIFLPVIAR